MMGSIIAGLISAGHKLDNIDVITCFLVGHVLAVLIYIVGMVLK